MNLPPNPFKAALGAGRQQIGIWNVIPNSLHTEALATCGFDWMLIDTEHTPVTLPTVLTMLQSVDPSPTHAVVRPGWNDATEIKHLLDIGARTLLVPYVQNAAEATRAVEAVRYAPQGMRGMAGLTRAGHFGQYKDYATRANDEVCLLVQVETVEALAEIEAIAAVDGVDGIFIGPADLAASMGLPGQPTAPQVRAAVLDGIRRIVAAGKPAGMLTPDQGFAREAVAAGTSFTAIGIDMALLLTAARGLAENWKRDAPA
ncbi:HpcH/HpaI aldolase family protein [Frigidibacter sp. ROC022]|uniref:HpcH/HpaI aldolase family protein n=1 Tax=Frigidibacter sp. ROC022 TaxID=2971796 RepID=UPI00215ABFCB|nr:HpcH/HpaI aldolase/citrate lyase family protein [Frigidibacter sp. ROC022]MCR8724097.1 HpcH/HpaI aldolase/citrate lyase family protein [Frigidibacter sp. ROC022]